MSGQWYYQLLMEEFGPVSGEELIELFNSGTLSDDAQVREDSGDWLPLGDALADLQSSATSEGDSAEEISDLSELAFEFEDSGPTKTRNVSGRSQGQSATPEVVSPAPAMASPVRSVATASPGDQPAAPAIVASDAWYYMSFGHMMGPMSFDALQALAQTGVITSEDAVRCGTGGGWRRAKNLPRLAIAMAIAQTSVVPPGQTIGSSGSIGTVDEASANADGDPSQTQAMDAQGSTSEANGDTSAKEEAKGKSPRRKGDKKRVRTQEELPDDVFDDIFSSSTSPTPPMSRPPASTATSSSNAPVEADSKPVPEAPRPEVAAEAPSRPVAPAYSPPPEPMAPRALTSPMMASRPIAEPALKKKSSGKGFSIDPKTMGIIGGVIGVLLLGAAIWKFGLPLGGSEGPFKPKFVTDNLNKVMQNIDKAVATKKPTVWAETVGEAKVAVGIVLSHAQSSGNKSPAVTATMGAVSALQKILATTVDDKDGITKAKAEFQELIAKVK